MADITASTVLRDFIADQLTTAKGCYIWVTLHSDITLLSASSVYATSGLNELTTGNGYTAGGTTAGTITQTAGVIDTPDVVWTTAAGQTLTAGCCAMWINDTNLIAGAALVAVKDTAATASEGGTLTYNIANPITIPTPV